MQKEVCEHTFSKEITYITRNTHWPLLRNGPCGECGVSKHNIYK